MSWAMCLCPSVIKPAAVFTPDHYYLSQCKSSYKTELLPGWIGCANCIAARKSDHSLSLSTIYVKIILPGGSKQLAMCLTTHLGILGLHNKIWLVMSHCLIIVISFQNFSKLGGLYDEVILSQRHCITSTKRAILYCTGYTVTSMH